METEAKANCRCCFVGENCRTHGFYSDCVADKFIKGVQGQKSGGYLYITFFIIQYMLGGDLTARPEIQR